MQYDKTSFGWWLTQQQDDIEEISADAEMRAAIEAALSYCEFWRWNRYFRWIARIWPGLTLSIPFEAERMVHIFSEQRYADKSKTKYRSMQVALILHGNVSAKQSSIREMIAWLNLVVGHFQFLLYLPPDQIEQWQDLPSNVSLHDFDELTLEKLEEDHSSVFFPRQVRTIPDLVLVSMADDEIDRLRWQTHLVHAWYDWT